MDIAASPPKQLEVSITETLSDIDAETWHTVAGSSEPFLRYEFLSALERQSCVGGKVGWHPRHLLVRDEAGKLLGAMPMYVKTNSFGEFVFDWSWASAYRESGMEYYPKLVVSIPFTPVTGSRLLVHPDADADLIRKVMVKHAIEIAEENDITGIHWLFPTGEEARFFRGTEMTMRLGFQYHWCNNGYACFDDFLGAFNSRKRKKVRRERRRVEESGVTFRVIHGNEADEATWETVHEFYENTFEKKGNYPALTLDFFKEIGRTMGGQIVLVMARHDGFNVACAVNFRSDDALYGRYWGCSDDFHSLHFETCYYQGIEYCINNGIRRFEPGAQGEHKIGRGFLPTRTWSAHWIADTRFRKMINNFCRQERQLMELECHDLGKRSPFRLDSTPPVLAP